MRQLDHLETRIAILDALLGARATPGRARAILERAEQLECDPLTVLVHDTGEDQDHVYRRAAALFGLPYAGDIVPFIQPFGASANLDACATLKSVRGHIRGKDVVFLAPGLRQLMALAAWREGRRQIVVTNPRALLSAVADVNTDRLATDAIQRTIRQYPNGCANTELRKGNRYLLLLAILAVISAAFFAPLWAQPVLLPLLAVLLVSPSLLRLWAAITAPSNRPLMAENLLPDEDLPVYSVLVPLRDEAHMVPQMAEAIKRFDYPPEKLDVKFVVESTSPRTILMVKRYLTDARFSLVVVPRRPPYTKPKALNFALPLARGKYVTVFDAEDVPERTQLRKAATLFAQHPDIACMQAHLLITNTKSHWIAKLFAAEYAGHFGVLLPAIARLGMPLPLGGTSNHFRLDILRDIGGWDAFNVTEDADLGIRLGRLGHCIATFASYTSEESTTSVKTWMRQRGRWMKGWMQTLIVHNASPRRLLADFGWRKLIVFQVMVGGMVLSISVHGLLLLSTMVQTFTDVIGTGAPALLTWYSLGILALGYIGAIATSAIGLARTGRRDLWGWLALLPLYWLLAWAATIGAAFELIRRPYHWAKTHHVGSQSGLPDTETR